MGSSTEDIIKGMWLVENTNMPEGGLIFNCSRCCATFEDRISYEIHLQGLRHEKASKMRTASPDESMSAKNGSKKLKHMSQLETILHEERKPLLGLNYVTEYFHASGYYECICNMCGKVFDSIHSMQSHIFAASHMLNFMFFWDKEMYNAMKFKSHDENAMSTEASKLESVRRGRLCRTKIMEELGNVWVEFQHEGYKSDTNLIGHQLSSEYDIHASLIVTELNNFTDLITEFQKLFLLSNGLPPSCILNDLNTLHFLDILSKMTIRNERDADVCLQLANFLTVSLLRYRMKQVKNMKFVDAASVRAKLNHLTDEAEKVAEKLQVQNQL